MYIQKEFDVWLVFCLLFSAFCKEFLYAQKIKINVEGRGVERRLLARVRLLQVDSELVGA